MQTRQSALQKWLTQTLNDSHYTLNPLTGDASFRRYYRLHYGQLRRIVMDAPPDKETIAPFVQIGNALQQTGIKTPIIYAADVKQGFALLEDFGDALLLDVLTQHNADHYYQQALHTLITLQTCPVNNLPAFDEAHMMQEMRLCKTWFVEGYLQLTLSRQEEQLLHDTFTWLSSELAKHPVAFIHRDYHSRNIMLLENNTQLGIIDFQDAMVGPLAYDLVSLLKDCYIQWPREQVMQWVSAFHRQSPLAQQLTLPAFIRVFELCGLQRHLKVLGVFCRLFLRDNKAGYLKDLPLTLHYTLACLESYNELQEFYQFMLKRIKLP